MATNSPSLDAEVDVAQHLGARVARAVALADVVAVQETAWATSLRGRRCGRREPFDEPPDQRREVRAISVDVPLDDAHQPVEHEADDADRRGCRG